MNSRKFFKGHVESVRKETRISLLLKINLNEKRETDDSLSVSLLLKFDHFLSLPRGVREKLDCTSTCFDQLDVIRWEENNKERKIPDNPLEDMILAGGERRTYTRNNTRLYGSWGSSVGFSKGFQDSCSVGAAGYTERPSAPGPRGVTRGRWTPSYM